MERWFAPGRSPWAHRIKCAAGHDRDDECRPGPGLREGYARLTKEGPYGRRIEMERHLGEVARRAAALIGDLETAHQALQLGLRDSRCPSPQRGGGKAPIQLRPGKRATLRHGEIPRSGCGFRRCVDLDVRNREKIDRLRGRSGRRNRRWCGRGLGDRCAKTQTGQQDHDPRTQHDDDSFPRPTIGRGRIRRK